MKALLLVAHGSRRKLSNDEVASLAKQLKQNCGDDFQIVHAAFLELTDPLFPKFNRVTHLICSDSLISV